MKVKTGQTISHYRIIDKLGEGGMGVVYKAEDITLKREVVLKFLPSHLIESIEVKERFLREAQAAAALVHPNIASVFDFEVFEDQSFIVMELIEGQTLREFLRESMIDIDETIEIIIAVADALSHAHRKGIIHRDIKPGNIMVSTEKKCQFPRSVKVMDFGLAKIKERGNLTMTGSLLGTVSYMSPEQAGGASIDQRSDIFSLGVVFFEMLTGCLPFEGETIPNLLYNIVHKNPRPLSGRKEKIPSFLEEIVFKCLHKQPEKRYQTMIDLLQALAEFQYKPQSIAIKAGPKKKSIAVLPFEDISPEKKNEYLADGMTEELITVLSQNRNLRVIARTSIMQYKTQTKDVREIARELGVDYVLEGSVRRFKDNLRVSSQLIDSEDGAHLWVDKYDGVMRDIFNFQEDVARAVTNSLEIELELNTKSTSISIPNPQAYELYIQGKFLLDVPTLKNLDQASVLLNRAVEIEPDYADVYGILSSVYLWYVDTGLRPSPEYLIKAEESAKRALSLNKNQPDALYALANLDMKNRKIVKAFQGFSRSLEIDPNQKDAAWWKALLLCFSSYFEEALQEADRMLEVNPFWPMAHFMHSTIRMFQGVFDAAIAEYEQVVTEVPSKLVWLSLCYRYADRMDKAWEAAQKVKQLEPEGILWPSAYAFLEGAEGKGRKILKYVDDRLKAFGWEFHIVCYWVASVYALADERDEAFRWLNRGIELGCRNYRWFEIDPNLHNIRKDPRFIGFMEKAKSAAKKLEKYI